VKINQPVNVVALLGLAFLLLSPRTPYPDSRRWILTFPDDGTARYPAANASR
jgi:hypothetical protein